MVPSWIVMTLQLPLKIHHCRQLSVSKSEPVSPGKYCVSLVKKYDNENFLCTLLLPKDLQSSAFAVRAFNVEIANVLGRTKESQIALMRLKFWEDALDKIFLDAPPQQPVTIELAKAVKKGINKRTLKRLISSRAENLKLSLFPNLASMEDYAENTVSPVLYALLEASGIKNVHADHAASHIGKAQGIFNLIRGLPFNIQSGQLYLPQDILVKNKVVQENILRGKSNKPLQDAIFEIASRAKQHLDKARNLTSSVPKEAYPIFLPAFTVESNLENLRLVDFDVYSPKFQKKDGLLPLKLYWKKFLHKY
nr:PREDICTED: NADH dehydrogenase (ubiquinone) complex I, assembly factor 6 [Bemisia tabaci]